MRHFDGRMLRNSCFVEAAKPQESVKQPLAYHDVLMSCLLECSCDLCTICFGPCPSPGKKTLVHLLTALFGFSKRGWLTALNCIVQLLQKLPVFPKRAAGLNVKYIWFRKGDQSIIPGFRSMDCVLLACKILAKIPAYCLQGVKWDCYGTLSTILWQIEMSGSFLCLEHLVLGNLLRCGRGPVTR